MFDFDKRGQGGTTPLVQIYIPPQPSSALRIQDIDPHISRRST